MATTDSGSLASQKFELLDPDVRLMMEVREGNAAAFEQLVARYQKRLIMVLQHLVGDREQAEDLAQEVFLRIYRARGSYIPTAKFSTWLYTITHNVANNSNRKTSRRKEVNLAPVSDSADNSQAMKLESIAKDKSSLMPARIVDQKELRKVLEFAIQGLPARQRMATMLSRFEGMSYQEIADTMDLSVQAVKSLLSRARLNLKIALEPYLELGNQKDLAIQPTPEGNSNESESASDSNDVKEEIE